MLRCLLICLLCPAFVLADEPVTPIPAVAPDAGSCDPPPIRFPLIPTPERPLAPVTPVTPVDPDAVPSLTYGQIYVVESDADFFLRAHPKRLVEISPPVAGPVTVRGIFAGGSGKIETRVIKSAFVFFVDVLEGASGQLLLTATPVGVTNEANITEQLIDIIGPRPPPDPRPVDPIIPTPTPVPTGFRVLMIYETAANHSREQLNTLHSTKIAAYLNAKCAKGENSVPEWRRYDPDIEIRPSESKTITQLWATVKPSLERTKLPWLVISVNGTATGHPLPATEAETLALLKSKGGE